MPERNRVFEVERRFLGHIPIPKGFKLIEQYTLIKDVYYSIDPQIRIRYMQMAKPDKTEKNKMTLKRPRSAEIMEYETPTGDFDTAQEIFSAGMGNPVTYVSGTRDFYTNGEINLFSDVIESVHKIGDKWTEVEIIVKQTDGIKVAEENITKLLAAWNVKPEVVEKQTYVEMKLKNLVLDAIQRAEPELLYTADTLARYFKCLEERIVSICTILENEKKISSQLGKYYPIPVKDPQMLIQ